MMTTRELHPKWIDRMRQDYGRLMDVAPLQWALRICSGGNSPEAADEGLYEFSIPVEEYMFINGVRKARIAAYPNSYQTGYRGYEEGFESIEAAVSFLLVDIIEKIESRLQELEEVKDGFPEQLQHQDW